MKKLTYLLPGGFRFYGLIFTLAGAMLGTMRFYFGVKPDLLEQKAFAVYSVYLGTKTLRVVNNQLIDEIAGVLLIAGLFMIAFAREKNENPLLNSIRLKAFFISIYLNTVFLIFSLLFTFGLAFMYMSIMNLVLPLLLYIISFRILAGIEKIKNPDLIS